MDWTLIPFGFSLAVLMGAALVSLLARISPEWSQRRRRLTAASALPVITASATILGILFVASANHGQSEHMEDLAIAAMATLGGGFTLLAWIGGLIGATLAGRRRRG